MMRNLSPRPTQWKQSVHRGARKEKNSLNNREVTAATDKCKIVKVIHGGKVP